MNKEKPVEKVAIEPEQPTKGADADVQQVLRKSIKVQSDIRAGLGATQGNGHIYP